MKELKLRAWWPDVKKLVYFDGPYVGCDALDKWGIHFPVTAGPVFLGDAQIEVCTGLKDKKGKDIFEGDIIKGDEDGNDSVVWKENKFILEPLGDDCVYWDRCEVIGNIHETPDLLQDV